MQKCHQKFNKDDHHFQHFAFHNSGCGRDTVLLLCLTISVLQLKCKHLILANKIRCNVFNNTFAIPKTAIDFPTRREVYLFSHDEWRLNRIDG